MKPVSAQRRARIRWAVCMAALVLAGCGGVPQWEKPGAPRGDVIKRLGSPTAVYALPSGERLQYSWQPYGAQVYNLDFDAAGRLLSVDQALEPEKFDRIIAGQWSAGDVERLLGKPALIERVARFDGDIWTYRYKDFSGYRRLHVHLDPTGLVRKVMSTDEPIGEPRELHEGRR
jgi:hypothetical protein